MTTNSHFRLAGPSLNRYLLTVVIMLVGASSGIAATLHNVDFEGIPHEADHPPIVGFSVAQVNIGGSDFVLDITEDGGVDGSQGITTSFDGTGRPVYSIQMGIKHSGPGRIDPLGYGPSQLRFSVELKLEGAATPTPVALTVFQFDSEYEAKRGVDANMDGDMSDGATIFSSTFRPVVANSSDYQNYGFLLSEGEISASAPPSFPGPPVSTPLVPQFDPAVGLSYSISYGSDGFGSDEGNSVSIDNILISAIPEPRTSAILALCLGVVWFRCRHLVRSLGRGATFDN